MANFKVLAPAASGSGTQQIGDTDVALLGNIAPDHGGDLTLGSAASDVVVFTGKNLTVDGAGALLLTGGAALTGAAGSLLSGFDSVEGITSANLLDKTAAETITEKWIFQGGNAITPKLVVKANGGEAGSTILFQVQTSAGANRFSVDMEGDCIAAGNVDIVGTVLSFNGAATIDTSAAGNLGINVGANSVILTAALADLRTGVTALDVPTGIGFMIGGSALTTAAFTALNVDALLKNLSNVDTLHSHGVVRKFGLTTGGIAQYLAGYVSADNTVLATDASVASGTEPKATCFGVYDGVASSMVLSGAVVVQFEAGLVAPAPTAGQPVFLSWTTAGKFVNDASTAPSDSYVTYCGIMVDASTYGVAQRCTISLMPQRPVYVP
jgi:hypothetical protein